MSKTSAELAQYRLIEENETRLFGLSRLDQSFLKSLATTLGICCIPVALLTSHPVLADENRIETTDLESVKKNWVDESNNTEYMKRGSESFKRGYNPNCDRHGCYNHGSSKSSW